MHHRTQLRVFSFDGVPKWNDYCYVHDYIHFVFSFDISESYDVQEAKNFFEQNYSHVYYIFYDVFIITEADLKQRGN